MYINDIHANMLNLENCFIIFVSNNLNCYLFSSRNYQEIIDLIEINTLRIVCVKTKFYINLICILYVIF